MLLNKWIGLVIVILIAIGLFLLAVRLIMKRWPGIPIKIRLLMCLVVALGPLVYPLETILFPVIIINTDGSTSEKMLLGSTEISLGNGQNKIIEFDHPNSIVVNQSDRDYMIEVVRYGSSYSSEYQDRQVKAHDVVVSKLKVSYLPDESPPDEISIKRGQKTDKGWLRLKYTGEE